MSAPLAIRTSDAVSGLIMGLTADALIAPWVIKGAMPLGRLLRNLLPVVDGPAFAAYVSKVLVPEIEPGTVVILNNLSTHRNVEASRAQNLVICSILSKKLQILPLFLFRLSQ